MDILASITANLLIYSLLLVSLNNFIIGKTSLLPVGHLAFFGIGSFTTGILVADCHFSGWVALALSLLLGALVSMLVSLTTLRLTGDYFIVLSIGLCELVRAASITIRGPSGITGLSRPTFFGLSLDDTWMFIWCVLMPTFALVLLLAYRFSRSPLERICILMRQSDVVARLQGIPTLYYRIGCFVIGSVIATLAGGLYTFYSKSTDPTVYTIYQGILLFAMVLFGGVNSIKGSVVGGVMLVLVPRILEFFINTPTSSYYSAQVIQIAYGVLLVAVIRFMPQGIMATSQSWVYNSEDL